MAHWSLSAALLLAAASVAGSATAPGPRIEVDSRIGDVGMVHEGQREFVSHTFVLRNTGDDTLRIMEVRAGCRCTVTEYDSVIAPGTLMTVRQVVDIAGFHEGPFERGIQVMSNAVNTPQLPLVVRGVLRSFVEIDYFELRIPAGTERLPGVPVMYVRSPMRGVQITEAEFIPEGDRMAPWHTALPLALQWKLTPIDRTDSDGYRYNEFMLWYPEPVDRPIKGLCHIRTNHPREPDIRMRAELLPVPPQENGEPAQ